MTKKRQLEGSDRKPPNESNATSEPPDKIRRLNEDKNEFSLESVECKICLDVVCSPTMRSLPCGHVFHEICLFQWLEISDICPFCKWSTRVDVDSDEDGRNEHEQESAGQESSSSAAESEVESPRGGQSPRAGSPEPLPQVNAAMILPDIYLVDVFELYDLSSDSESEEEREG